MITCQVRYEIDPAEIAPLRADVPSPLAAKSVAVSDGSFA
jgi:hypothetical protein